MRPRFPRVFSRIGFRLMLFNGLLVFAPLAGVMVLDVFQDRMLRSQEDMMASQARVLAASLGAALDAAESRGLEGLADASLRNLGGRTVTRLRVLGLDGGVLADTSRMPADKPSTPAYPDLYAETGLRGNSAVTDAPPAASKPSPLNEAAPAPSAIAAGRLSLGFNDARAEKAVAAAPSAASPAETISAAKAKKAADAIMPVPEKTAVAKVDESFAKVPTAGDATGKTQAKGKSGEDPFTSFIYQLGSMPFRVIRSFQPPAPAADGNDDGYVNMRNPAVNAALGGRYGAYTIVSSGQRSVTLYSAFPVRRSTGAIVGAVLASQSTWRTLQDLYEIRIALFQVILASVAIALALSFLIALTISRPLKRMTRMADSFIDRWGRPTGEFKPVRGSDELASLSKSLSRLGAGLSDHIRFIESFAADLAHELRNPLASIRAAGELFEAGGDDATSRERLSSIVAAEAARIDRLVALSRDLSKMDVAMGRCARVPVDLRELAAGVAADWAIRGVQLALSGPRAGAPAPVALADQAFLRQAVDKLVENAIDFSPEPGSVELRVDAERDRAVVVVADRGPGVAKGMEEDVFKRFYTERKEGGHTGLGLALARTIAEGFGGSLGCANREEGGAVFTLRLPLVD